MSLRPEQRALRAATNLAAIKRDVLEETVLSGLQLMDPALIEIFCTEYTRHLNRLRIDATALQAGYKAELAKTKRELTRIVDAICDGVEAATVKDRMAELEALLANAPAPSSVLIHPKMGERYRQEVARLRHALNEDSRRVEAAEIIRSLVDEIKLTPVAEDGRTTWSLDLSGHLAGILSLARAGKEAGGRQVKLVAGTGLGLRLPKTDELDRQIKMVAGARFDRDLKCIC